MNNLKQDKLGLGETNIRHKKFNGWKKENQRWFIYRIDIIEESKSPRVRKKKIE